MRLMSALVVMAIVTVGILFTSHGGATALSGGTWYYSPQTGPRGPVYDDSGDVGYLTSTGFTRSVFYQIMDGRRRPHIDLSNDPAVDGPQRGDETESQVDQQAVPHHIPRVIGQEQSIRKDFSRIFHQSKAPILGSPVVEPPESGEVPDVEFPVSESVGCSPTLNKTTQAGGTIDEFFEGMQYHSTTPAYQLPEPWYQLQ